MNLWMRFSVLVVIAVANSAIAAAQSLDQDIVALIRDYDRAKFESANADAQQSAMSALIQRADGLAKRYPQSGEPLIWKGILQADQSAAQRSLGQVKDARKTLEAALALTANAYSADAHSTLGSMYANVPGFPLAFGDKKKARAHLQKALALNPTHVGGNLNYANLLLKDENYAEAIKHVQAALSGLPRAGRDKADKASRANADAILAKAQAKLR